MNTQLPSELETLHRRSILLKAVPLETVSGRVEEFLRFNDAHVSGGGGAVHGYSANGIGHTYGQISDVKTKTAERAELWIVTPEGQELQFKLSAENLSVREGHFVSIVRSKDSGHAVLLSNHTTGECSTVGYTPEVKTRWFSIPFFSIIAIAVMTIVTVEPGFWNAMSILFYFLCFAGIVVGALTKILDGIAAMRVGGATKHLEKVHAYLSNTVDVPRSKQKHTPTKQDFTEMTSSVS